jgi:carbon-monoxide dehydrogenase medium subunit
MKSFKYLRPRTLEEALSLLRKHGPEARVIAGGTDLVIYMKRGDISPKVLISLNRIQSLRHIEECEGCLRMGSIVTLRDIEKSDLVRNRYWALSDAVDNMGSPLIRNVATIGGNICNAAPSADTAGPLLVHDCLVRVASPDESREIPLDKFFTGPGSTVLSHDEIVTEFVICRPTQATGSAYWKHARRKALDLANVGVAVLLGFDGNKNTCKKARIALGVSSPTPIRAYGAEKSLTNKKIDEAVLQEAGEIAEREANPRDSYRGEAWYRKSMIRVFVKRMGLLACERANRKV